MLPPDAPSRADALLAVMAAALACGFGVGMLSAVPLRLAGSAGSLAAGVALADGLYRPP